MSRQQVFWLLTPLLGAFMLPGLVRAEEPNLKREITKLFEIGWQPSLKSHAAADEQYAELTKLARGDRRVPYAYALVKIRQRKYADAARLLAGVLEKDTDNWHAWRVKIWLSMLTKQYAAAMSEMQQLAQRVAAVDTDSSPGRVDNLQVGLARFLGRMFGFLAGPAAGDVPPAAVAEARRVIEARLDDRQRAVFVESMRGVTDRYAQMSVEQADTRDQALADAQQRNREIADDLQRQRDRIAEDSAGMEPLREKLESEYQTEIADLTDKEQPLIQQMTRLEIQAAPLQREILSLGADIDLLERRAARERDRFERQRLLREADRLAIIQRRFQNELLLLDGEYDRVKFLRAGLLAQGQQVAARHQRELTALQNKAEDFQRNLRRIELEERKLDKPVKGNNPRVRELERVAKAFTTYEQLPLESERAHILSSFD